MQTLITQPDTFDPAAFDRLVRAEPGHFWFEERRRLIGWALGRHFPQARSFCDVGCGTGFVLAGITLQQPALKLTGIDPYSQALAHAARRLAGVELHQGDIMDSDFPAAFDVVGCFDVLEHIPDDQRALDRLTARVRPGGGLILTVPQHPRLWSAADEIGHHQRRDTRPQLLSRLKASGLVCVRVTSFMTSLLPVMWVRRNVSPSREQALAELHPSRTANMLGRVLLRVESRLIAAGVSLPWGGSLLVVAVKPTA
jgi:SAM-dependent methyltransferase